MLRTMIATALFVTWVSSVDCARGQEPSDSSSARQLSTEDKLSKANDSSEKFTWHYIITVVGVHADYLWDRQIWGDGKKYPEWNLARNRAFVPEWVNVWTTRYVKYIQQDYKRRGKPLTIDDFKKIVKAKCDVYKKYMVFVDPENPGYLLVPAADPPASKTDDARQAVQNREYARAVCNNIENDAKRIGRDRLRDRLRDKFFEQLRQSGIAIKTPATQDLPKVSAKDVAHELGFGGGPIDMSENSWNDI